MNIAEILKDCPKGTKLYSLVDGEVTLKNVFEIGPYPIGVAMDDGTIKYYTTDGLHFTNQRKNGECVLFPSKDQRDWSKFGASDQESKPQFEPFDKVLARDSDYSEWVCDIFSHLEEKEDCLFACIGTWWRQCIPYEGNEHLLGTTNKP